MGEPKQELQTVEPKDLGSSPALACLKDDEANFVYNVEVLGLPTKKAAMMAGMPLHKQSRPHIVQAREVLKQQVRGSLNITKEDVVFGIKEAVDRARILSEPQTEINGWKEISKLLGYDTPQRVDIQITAAVGAMQNQVATMSDAELVQALGAEDLVDVDFYEITDE